MTCYADACVKEKKQAALRAFHERRVADGRWELQNAKRRKVERHPCADCGQEVWNSHGPRCRDCSQVFARMLRRAAGYGIDLDSAARVLVFERDGWICQLCSDPIDPALIWPASLSASVDHRIPLSKCLEHFGPDYVDSADNWQAAHLVCNTAKGARMAS
jgi:5-methylcytosine-specific restriction endonuclease McrA